MASTFWALSVGSGEAFLLRTRHSGRDWTVLVDSGRSGPRQGKHPLVEAIRKADRSISHIDVAVCTHQDADHATGFATFADWWARNGRSIGEFWLPGRWSAAFPQIISDPFSFLHTLQTGTFEATERLNREDLDTEIMVPELGARLRSIAPLEEIAQHFREVASTDGLEPVTEEFDSIYSVRDYFDLEHDPSEPLMIEDDGYDDLLLDLSSTARQRHWYPWIGFGKDPVHQAVFLTLLSQVIETAISIRRIAVSALRNSIRVRWFDFGLLKKSSAQLADIRDSLSLPQRWSFAGRLRLPLP